MPPDNMELALIAYRSRTKSSSECHQMRRFIAVISFALVISPALAQSVGEKTGLNSAMGVSPSTAVFVKEAASSDMFEIASSRLAEQRAADPATKAFAAKMIADHEKTTADIKAMVSRGAVKAEVPTEMTPAHAALLDKLKGLNGGAFTKQYHDEQVTAHKQAVSLYERYAKGGDNTGLKDWAGKTQPILEEHLKMAQHLDT